MASFDKAQAFVKVAEGGYQKMSADSGNYYKGLLVGTNHGISAPVLAAYLGRDITEADMRALTYDTALLIYKKNYWDVIGGDKIIDPNVALILYDSAVNQGTGAVSSIVSKALGINASTPFTSTVDVINNYPDQEELFNKIKAQRKARYDASSSSPFYDGWMNRLNSIVYSVAEQFKSAAETVKKNL